MHDSIQVLLATYNGARWLDEQLQSILNQTCVSVEVLVCDDQSTDETPAILSAWAARDRRVRLLQSAQRFGNAADNFYHLLKHADTRRFAFIALADQDDIWDSDKLERHVDLLKAHAAAGVSSDVLAFWANGREHLIRKSQPQRLWDHLLEPPGPGCTFLMTSSLVQTCVHWLNKLPEIGFTPLPKHDWFIYLIARSSGRSWHIEARSSLRYRQHANNEVGANSGLRAIAKRLAVLFRGGYHSQVQHAIRLARVISIDCNLPPPPLHLSAWELLRNGRRRRHEALVMAIFSLRGV